jgi:hypothetical protein
VQSDDRKIGRRLGASLSSQPQVHNRVDSVVDERTPASLREALEVVGPDVHAEARLAAALGRMATEVADVQQAVPDEVAGAH